MFLHTGLLLPASLQSGKLLKRMYHYRSTYRYVKAHIELVKNAKLIHHSTYQISFS